MLYTEAVSPDKPFHFHLMMCTHFGDHKILEICYFSKLHFHSLVEEVVITHNFTKVILIDWHIANGSFRIEGECLHVLRYLLHLLLLLSEEILKFRGLYHVKRWLLRNIQHRLEILVGYVFQYLCRFVKISTDALVHATNPPVPPLQHLNALVQLFIIRLSLIHLLPHIRSHVGWPKQHFPVFLVFNLEVHILVSILIGHAIGLILHNDFLLHVVVNDFPLQLEG